MTNPQRVLIGWSVVDLGDYIGDRIQKSAEQYQLNSFTPVDRSNITGLWSGEKSFAGFAHSKKFDELGEGIPNMYVDTLYKSTNPVTSQGLVVDLVALEMSRRISQESTLQSLTTHSR